MGTTSEKLTYLNTTKTLIKEELNLGGANITTEPFRQYKSKLDGIYKDFLANGTDTLWNNWEKVSGSGTEISLNNTIEAKMDFVYKGNTYQYSTTGKNLCYFSNFTEGGVNFNGSEINVGNTTGGAVYVGSNFNLQDDTSKSGKTYTIYACVNGTKQTGSVGTGLSINFAKTGVPVAFQVGLASSEGSFNNRIYVGTITLGENEVFRNVSVVTNNAITANINVKVMIVEGSYTEQTIGDYEPYTNGASPNPDYPQDIQVVSGNNSIYVCGKNLLDGELELGGYSGGTGVKQTANDNYRNKNIIEVKPNTTYTFSINGVSQKYVLFYYTSSQSFISSTTGLTTGTFTTPNNCYYINFRCFASDFTSDFANLKVQLEKGSTATAYTPYVSQTYEIDLRTSKNLFDISAITRGYELNANTGGIKANANWWVSDYIGIKPNTDYTSSNISSLTKCWYDSNKNFISKVQATTGTSPSNARYLRVNGTLASIESNPNLMIEEGDTATTYEPYNSIELCKIGDYQDKIAKSTGKNLFDKDNVVGGFVNADGSVGGDTNAYRTSNFIPIQPNTAYYKTSTESPRTKYYDSNKQPLNTMTYQDILIGGNAGTFTTPNNAYYLRFSYPVSSVNANSIMINEGTTALPYEPYGKVWYLNKQIGKVVLDGSESWQENGATKGLFQVTKSNVISILNEVLVKSTHFRAVTGQYLSDNASTEDLITSNFTNNRLMFIYKQYANNLTDFKTWLSTHNLIVYYVLATPTTTEITDSTLISQLEAIKKSYNNQTNISQTNTDKPFILDVVALGELEI